MKVITETADLQTGCESWSRYDFITVDLEFLREHTYYSKLCLIQIGSPGECAIIDPLAENLSLAPFFELMQNPKVTKVFHSGRQDIEIIYNLSGKIPIPVFDTQIAGMVTGYGESASYDSLVKSILNISLDKSSRLSDWSLRPLNETQLEYALADVTHLVHIYEHLRQKLKDLKREHWADEEIAVLTSPETYEVKPENAWMRIRHRSHSARYLTLLRELAAWRERRSQIKNTPRQSYIKDEMLLTIASMCPHSQEELARIHNLRKDIAGGRLGKEIIEVIKKFETIPENKYVTPPPYKTPAGSNSALLELLKLLLKIISQQEGVVARLIASDEDLKNFSTFENDDDNPILKGWRREIFGQKATELRNGKLSLRYNPKTRRIDL